MTDDDFRIFPLTWLLIALIFGGLLWLIWEVS